MLWVVPQIDAALVENGIKLLNETYWACSIDQSFSKASTTTAGSCDQKVPSDS